MISWKYFREVIFSIWRVYYIGNFLNYIDRAFWEKFSTKVFSDFKLLNLCAIGLSPLFHTYCGNRQPLLYYCTGHWNPWFDWCNNKRNGSTKNIFVPSCPASDGLYWDHIFRNTLLFFRGLRMIARSKIFTKNTIGHAKEADNMK